MYRANTLIDTDVLEAVRETAKEAPRAMRRELGKIARGPLAQGLIRQLSREPGTPRYPIRWKSQRQRRYVMAHLRESSNLPYQRTHRLAQGWTVTLDSIQDGEGLIRVENPSRYADFVQGDYAQPFHLDTGWPQAGPLISEFSEPFQDAIIDAWLRVNDVRNV